MGDYQLIYLCNTLQILYLGVISLYIQFQEFTIIIFIIILRGFEISSVRVFNQFINRSN